MDKNTKEWLKEEIDAIGVEFDEMLDLVLKEPEKEVYEYFTPEELENKEEQFSKYFPKIILTENPQRFNSGKELYDFLEKLQIDVKKIKNETSNKIY
jgi:hypothetical protein